MLPIGSELFFPPSPTLGWSGRIKNRTAGFLPIGKRVNTFPAGSLKRQFRVRNMYHLLELSSLWKLVFSFVLTLDRIRLKYH